MKFLLINPITGDRRLPAYSPLGLAYIASVLLDAEHEVEILDINAHRWLPDEVEARLSAAAFDAVGITGMVTEFAPVRRLAGLVRKVNPEADVILGGGLPSAFPRLVLERTEADIAVIGEGEVTITDLAKQLSLNGPLSDVKGIWYKQGGDLKATAPRELVEDLDTLPFPARHLFPIDSYIQNPVPYLRMFDRQVVSSNIVSSRGCPYRCAYCFHGLWGHRFRARSAENVVAEIKHLHEAYGVNGIFFMDDTFVLNRKRTLAICDRLIEEDMGITWVASGRVNLVDREVLERMRAAGCRVILYGIESGSQKILDEMCKGVTVEQARQAIWDTWNADILPVGYLMIGMFGETPQTVAETVRFCNETGLVSGFSYATPFPGTELYTRAEEAGKIVEDDTGQLLERWSEWTDEIVVNLSNLPDDDLRKLKNEAQKQIFWGNWWWKVRRYVRVLGVRNATREVVRYIQKILRIGGYT
jgi:radical SAM superfamily enzyme YgiQ (UPF0313 family)